MQLGKPVPVMREGSRGAEGSRAGRRTAATGPEEGVGGAAAPPDRTGGRDDGGPAGDTGRVRAVRVLGRRRAPGAAPEVR